MERKSKNFLTLNSIVSISVAVITSLLGYIAYTLHNGNQITLKLTEEVTKQSQYNADLYQHIIEPTVAKIGVIEVNVAKNSTRLSIIEAKHREEQLEKRGE